MHSKCDNTKIMINDEADEFIKELTDSLKNRYQNKLELVKAVNLPKIGYLMKFL